ncbi:MAG: serine/threonine protein kinase [Myxococcaceae bacterium]|nr:serine/threonine protein kinase [Myxococcaceae bacterium]
MSDNPAAKNDIDVETELDDDIDESVVADRKPRAPSLQRLGRYRLVREIASGGMATVNLAVTEGLDKLVALKIIHPHLAQEESFVRMFLDEARLASAISHRNVCNVFDFGETDGRYYIAMDYLSGQSLRDVLRRLRKTEVPIEPRKLAVYVAYMVAEACEGLHAAHELHGAEGKPLNVVHRDVSPHNLFVTYDGNVSVVDFGIARASDRIQSTATGVLKGKFSYMAPEQMRQLEIDRRADVWALGVVLWESLTLQRLFVRSSQADTVMSVMMDRVRPPSEVNPDIPKELDAVVLRSICRAPNQRYATAREMGRDLMKFCRESGVMVGPIEIEHLMERLFEKEISEAKALIRRAKTSDNQSGVWMDVTPSGFGRISRGSGAMEKGKWTSHPPSAPVDVMGEGSSVSTAMHVPPVSITAPAAEARSTAHTDLTDIQANTKKKPVVLLAAIGACALVAMTWLVVRKSEQTMTPLGTSELVRSAPSEPAVPSPQQVGAVATSQVGTETEPQPRSQVQPSEALEPTTIVPHHAAPAPVHLASGRASHNEPSRRTPARQAGRGGQGGQATPREQPDAESQGSFSNDEIAHGIEPSAAGSSHTQEEREDGSAAQHVASAPVAVQQAPAEPVAPEAMPTPRPTSTPRPTGPQRLDANAAVTDLDVEGSLGSGIVSRLLARATPGLKSCYVDAAKRANRNDFSSVQLSMLIDEGGAVRQVNASKHPLPELSSCASAVLKRMRSDRVPDVGTVQVKFKLVFTP